MWGKGVRGETGPCRNPTWAVQVMKAQLQPPLLGLQLVPYPGCTAGDQPPPKSLFPTPSGLAASQKRNRDGRASLPPAVKSNIRICLCLMNVMAKGAMGLGTWEPRAVGSVWSHLSIGFEIWG